MSIETTGPADVARRLGVRRDRQAGRRELQPSVVDVWRRETFTLSREEARVTARTWFERFPKAAHQTEIESWRELGDGTIEFTIRLLLSTE